MITELQLLVAVLLDTVFGDPKRFHPLAGFGHIALKIESFLYGSQSINNSQRKFRGVVAWALVVLPLVALTAWLTQDSASASLIIGTLLLYVTLGSQSLGQHAMAVSTALVNKDIVQARQQIQMMVSRDTAKMQDSDISRATIESVLENGNDAIFAAIFWFLILGAPGVVLYRLANTLDAMWGYRNARYHAFGWFAARVDDGLNWMPARLTALTYALVGKTRQAFFCWKTQAKQWKGFNPGVVMSAGAGALGLELGGAAQYHGQVVARPALGQGAQPNALDIKRSVQLVQRSLWLWLIIIFIAGVFYAV
ncbi:Adenosylcobinamide-phosphate synthase [hydrothermal vent metagenome]|uniref:Adenosylcobinamide-phosphate synthase n=1 Tax=hydrothermal vent metagenome TaxID=652676 RepID=A0A3B1ACH1_9ZZZZ